MHATKENSPGVSPSAPQVPYTRFSPATRWYLVALLGYITLASSLTATIYLPIIPVLATEYGVSGQAVNLTITLYIIFQAVSPAIFAPESDSLGRRPCLLIGFAIYLAASLGLALDTSHRYAVLMVLRGLQSFGGSSVMALAYGVVADVAVPAERGRMYGPLLAATNLGPCAGPVIGGAIARETGGSAWCFWTLVLFAATALLLIGFTLPETGRHVVGNGLVPARGPWKTWLETLMPGQAYFKWIIAQTLDDQKESRIDIEAELHQPPNAGKTGKGVAVIPNPLGPLRIIFYRDSFLTLWVAANVYAVWYCIQTSIPLVFGPIYGWDGLSTGLSYLPGGFGVIAGGFVSGRLMDRNYKVVARKSGLVVDRVAGDDVADFPVELARSRGSVIHFAILLCTLVGYGWSIGKAAHPSIALILQFIIGAECTLIHQTFNALLVDVFPDKPSTAAAAGNITRCGLSAAAVACIQPLVKALGYGWFFTLVGLTSATTGVMAIVTLGTRGHGWRNRRGGNRSE